MITLNNGGTILPILSALWLNVPDNLKSSGNEVNLFNSLRVKILFSKEWNCPPKWLKWLPLWVKVISGSKVIFWF